MRSVALGQFQEPSDTTNRRAHGLTRTPNFNLLGMVYCQIIYSKPNNNDAWIHSYDDE